jgi:hypothetical protein
MPDSRITVGLVQFLVATLALSQPSPNGGQFQVNTYTTDWQVESSVDADAQGNFVVVWASYGSDGTDTSQESIQAQRFAADGTPLGGQFQVNTLTLERQRFPSVAVSDQGSFVVAWQDVDQLAPYLAATKIKAQRFAADGAALGGEFQVNTYWPYYCSLPAVAVGSQGNFIVVWGSIGSPGSDNDSSSVQARRYAADGTPQGDQFQVNSFTNGYQGGRGVAIDGQGNFVVAWSSRGSSGTDSSSLSVQARLFDASGAPVTEDFQVNTYTTDLQAAAVVAFDAQGRFVVSWVSDGSDGSDSSRDSVQAQRFAADGTPLGGQFQVNSYTTLDQYRPSIAAAAGGDFVIAWTSAGSHGSDESGASIQAQRYRADGTALGGEFQVNTFTTAVQIASSVAADPRGNFVVTWSSVGSVEDDNSNYSIQAQRFDALFRDGFESGGTGRWSGAAP